MDFKFAPKARPAIEKPPDGAPKGATRTVTYACHNDWSRLMARRPPAFCLVGRKHKARTRSRRETMERFFNDLVKIDNPPN